MSKLSDIETWPKKQIREVCVIDPSKKEINGLDLNTIVSFGMMADLGENKRIFSPNGIKVLHEVKKGGFSYFKTNDVILAKMTPCFENGKSGIAQDLKNNIGFGSTEFYVIRSSGELDPNLLYYFISSDKFINEGKFNLIGTTGRRRLLKQFVEHFIIPIPPLEEQKQIASLFQSIETAIEQIEIQEKNLLNLRNTLINGLLGSKPQFGNLLNEGNTTIKKFGEVADCIEKHDKERDGITRFIGLENIEAGNFTIENWGDISAGTTFTKRFYKGDVLFGKRRSYLKKVAVADFDGICSGDILVFRAKEEVMLTGLLPYYVSSEAFIQHAVTTSAGSLSPRTKWKDLREFKFPIPDLKTQSMIFEVLNQIQLVSKQCKEQNKTLRTLKQNLLIEILG